VRLERVAVVGLGLLGGSVALAARERGVAREVVGATRSSEARAQALASGAVDRIAPIAEVARGADLVVLATPVGAMAAAVRQLAPGLGASFAQRAEGERRPADCFAQRAQVSRSEPQASEDQKVGERRPADVVVTDVGSVKSPLVDTLPGLLPPGCVYVGSHPMAGSHERGMSHARADLFERAVCIVTEASDALAGARVVAFWEALGARVVRRTAAQHDAEVAWVSHLPHLLAFAFARSLAQAPSAAAELAGAGFRDFTRIARSDAELWADILTANRKALAAPLGAAGAQLEAIARLLEAGDAEGLDRLLSAARSALFPAPPASRPETLSTEATRTRGDRSKGDSDQGL
jgi:prephenate dehydrogenase